MYPYNANQTIPEYIVRLSSNGWYAHGTATPDNSAHSSPSPLFYSSKCIVCHVHFVPFIADNQSSKLCANCNPVKYDRDGNKIS